MSKCCPNTLITEAAIIPLASDLPRIHAVGISARDSYLLSSLDLAKRNYQHLLALACWRDEPVQPYKYLPPPGMMFTAPRHLPQSWPPVFILSLASSYSPLLSSSPCSPPSPSLNCRLSTLCAATLPSPTITFHNYSRISERAPQYSLQP